MENNARCEDCTGYMLECNERQCFRHSVKEIFCDEARSDSGDCGPSGRYWEKRASDEKNAPAKKERR